MPAQTTRPPLRTARNANGTSVPIAKPGKLDSLADLDGGHTGAKSDDPADHFMAGNDGTIDARQLAVHDMQIGSAHSAGADPDAHGTSHRRRIFPLLKLERRAGRR